METNSTAILNRGMQLLQKKDTKSQEQLYELWQSVTKVHSTRQISADNSDKKNSSTKESGNTDRESTQNSETTSSTINCLKCGQSFDKAENETHIVKSATGNSVFICSTCRQAALEQNKKEKQAAKEAEELARERKKQRMDELSRRKPVYDTTKGRSALETLKRGKNLRRK
eukprot:m.13054 g.13054  ORF g.13054 m.13054 type:complete len:171 (-) comp4779_c0_seq1:33-545(-)